MASSSPNPAKETAKMILLDPESQDKTPSENAAPRSPWTPPHLDKLPVEDTAVASPTDIADAGIFS
jgi:hypothetical protein